MHDAILYLDNIAYTCYKAFSQEISIDHFMYLKDNPSRFLVNIMYNVGHMYSDIVNYLYFDWTTVENNEWAYFVFYHVGDFTMRLFFNASD